MEITKKKLAANRANGRKGGPKTPEGKRSVSQNARTHGLLAKEFVLSQDEKAEFEALQRGLEEDLQPRGALLWLLFGEVVACAWQVERARGFAQAEVQRILGASTDDGIEGLPTEGTSRAALVLANHPYTLTPSELRKRLSFLDDFQRVADHRIEEWKAPVTAVFGSDFWETVEEWRPTEPLIAYDLALVSSMRSKAEQYNLPQIEVEGKYLAPQEVIDLAVKVATLNERRQMRVKLIDVKRQALQAALQYAVAVETGEATANGQERLELFLRYQTTAKRDFFRALEEYEKRKKMATKV